MRFEAVTFDFWNTVMWETPGSLREHRLEYWLGIADGVAPDALAAAHDAAHEAYVAAWKGGRQFLVEDAARLIAGSLPALDQDMLLEGFCEGGRRATVAPCPGIHGCLGMLREAGLRLGLICDIGLTPGYVVRDLLQRESLLAYFDHMAFSDEVGYYKPSPEIFALALERLGMDNPARAAHVGDRSRTDIAGALRAGVQAIRYTAIYDDPVRDPAADVVLDHLGELPGVLGVR